MKTAPIFALMACIFAALFICACHRYDPNDPDTANLEGVWAIDNSLSRRPDEPPVMMRLTIYATHMEFCPGQGTFGTEGEWRDNGFWCEAKDGVGLIEAAKIVSPETIELHTAAFFSEKNEILALYKVQGSEDEQYALAARFPSHVSNPPPTGTIAVGMTEYQLLTLPWKPDQSVPAEGDSRDDDATVYSYSSNNPNISELKVTVKDHKVIAVNGGNG